MELKKIELCDGNDAIEITFDVTDDIKTVLRELFQRKDEDDDGGLEKR